MIQALKYLVYATSIYVLLSFIPKNRIDLVDILLIILFILSLNIVYEYIENYNSSVAEGYDPNPNTKLFSDKLEASEDNRGLFTKTDLENNQDQINMNMPSKINRDLEVEKPIVTGNLTNTDNNDESLDNNNESLDTNVTALDTSNSAGLASLELKKVDEDKKDKIQYEPSEKISNKFKYGYSYMDNNYWNLPAERKPVCKNIKPCNVCPRQTSGFIKDRMKWDNDF